MKKIIIGLMIVFSIGLVSCKEKNIDKPAIDNTKPQSSDQSNPDQTTPQSDTDSKLQSGKIYINELYVSLKDEVEKQKEKLNPEEWEKFKTDFNNKLNSVKGSVEDNYLNEAVDNLEKLSNEYDTAIREGVDVSKEKITEMKNKIEETLKK